MSKTLLQRKAERSAKRTVVASREDGFTLIAVMVLMMVAAVIVGASLQTTADNSRSVQGIRTRGRNFYRAEQSSNLGISWLRQQSTGIALLFSRTNFYDTFDRTTPSKGTNDSATFYVPTNLKLQGTNNSAILASSSTLATSLFPTSTDTLTGNAFNPLASFSGSSFGNNLVRVTLIDAIANDSTKDYGDTDSGAASPATDFNPIFRVDAAEDLSTGAHVYSYVTGSLALDYGVGFYGKTLVDFRQGCDSYLSNSGAYSNATKRPNCTVGSDGVLQIHGLDTVYGSAKTKGSINSASPYGGKVCADFQAGCPNPGQTCTGATCQVSGLPTYNTWASYCPTNQGDLSILANSTLTVPGNAANQKCWATVRVAAGRTLTLRTTSYPYFIDTFDLANNAVINFSPSPATGTINLYVRKFVGDRFNGNQVFNTNNKPYQLRIHYLGTDALTLNGTANISAFLVAPYTSVDVQGNFNYNGGIKALQLYATGSGELRYDESGDITTISDVTFRVRNAEERYR